MQLKSLLGAAPTPGDVGDVEAVSGHILSCHGWGEGAGKVLQRTGSPPPPVAMRAEAWRGGGGGWAAPGSPWSRRHCGLRPNGHRVLEPQGALSRGGGQRVGAGVSTWGLAVCGSDKMRPGSVAGWCTQGHGGRGQGARAWAASRSGQGVTASDGRGGVRRAGATWGLGASGPDALTSDRQIFTRMIRKL